MAAALAWVASPEVCARVYKCVDVSGTVSYSDIACTQAQTAPAANSGVQAGRDSKDGTGRDTCGRPGAGAAADGRPACTMQRWKP